MARCTTHGGRGVCGPKLVAAMMVMVALAWYSMRGEGGNRVEEKRRRKRGGGGTKLVCGLRLLAKGRRGSFVFTLLSPYTVQYILQAKCATELHVCATKRLFGMLRGIFPSLGPSLLFPLRKNGKEKGGEGIGDCRRQKLERRGGEDPFKNWRESLSLNWGKARGRARGEEKRKGKWETVELSDRL